MKQFCPATWSETRDDSLAYRRRPDGNLRRELRREIAELKSKARCIDFPTDVQRLAAHVGIRHIQQTPLAGRGRLIRVGGACDVEINQDLDSREQRFVIAHEITHMVLDSIRARVQGPELGYIRTEALCDFGAREILLPVNTVRHELNRTNTTSLVTLLAIADAADCALPVVVEVVSELPGRWKNLLFVWCSTRPPILDVSRVIPATEKQVEVVNDDSGLVATALRENRVVRGAQRIWFDDLEFELKGEALPLCDGEVVILAEERQQCWRSDFSPAADARAQSGKESAAKPHHPGGQ